MEPSALADLGGLPVVEMVALVQLGSAAAVQAVMQAHQIDVPVAAVVVEQGSTIFLVAVAVVAQEVTPETPVRGLEIRAAPAQTPLTTAFLLQADQTTQ